MYWDVAGADVLEVSHGVIFQVVGYTQPGVEWGKRKTIHTVLE